jgi:glycosyltransferase involved in cell wall biosynthesis
MQPPVTVIIPTYNRHLLIEQAIYSVILQTYSNWELIIVDDGSTDDTVQSIKRINDKRIRILELPHCGNIAQLRNTGVMNASGEWLAFLDSDDVWLPHKLEIQIQALSIHNKLWSYGKFEMIDEHGETLPFKYGHFRPYSGWIIKKLIINEASVAISSLVVQKAVFDKLGGFDTNPGLFCREDYEFILRLSINAEALTIAELITRVREHSNRSTNTFINGAERTANVFKFFYDNCTDIHLKKLVFQQYAYHLANAAERNLYQKKYLRAIKYFTKAIASGDKPRHLLSSFKHGFIKHKGAN